MRKSTNKELVEELTSRNTDGKLDEIIQEAKDGEYHDFKNNKYVCGKMALVDKLAPFPELSNIRNAVMQGDYDESPDEDDKAQMRADLVNDMGEDGAQELIEKLGLK